MLEFVDNFNWLLEGAVTAFLVLFISWVMKRRDNRNHFLNLVAVLAYEMKHNFDAIIMIDADYLDYVEFRNETWLDVRYDLAKHMTPDDFQMLAVTYHKTNELMEIYKTVGSLTENHVRELILDIKTLTQWSGDFLVKLSNSKITFDENLIHEIIKKADVEKQKTAK